MAARISDELLIRFSGEKNCRIAGDFRTLFKSGKRNQALIDGVRSLVRERQQVLDAQKK